MKHIIVGVLSFHGDVIEHFKATQQAIKNLNASVSVIEVRKKSDLHNLRGLILPGGESTTLHKLCVREGMFDDMKQIPYIFGTCAGAIMLAKKVLHKADGQETLERMDIEIDRNAYGRQTDSFERTINTSLGMVNAVFIRAPRIVSVRASVTPLAILNKEIIACEEDQKGSYTLAACFHPELTGVLFHEYFLKKILLQS